MPREYRKYHRTKGLSTIVLACLTMGFLGSLSCIGSEVQEDKHFIQNVQSAVITSKKVTVPKQEQGTEATGIFEGDVDFKYLKLQGTLSFHSDKLVTYVLKQTQMLRRVEMFGKVSMQQGEWSIYSKEAFSDNLNAYVDFSGDVTVRRNQEVIGANLKSLRFDTLVETISPRE